MSALIRWSEVAELRLARRAVWPVVLAVSTGSAALLMFLVHVVAVRVLSTSEYGEFSSAIALVGIVGVGATSVQAVTVREIKANSPTRTPLLSPLGEVTLLALSSLGVGLLAVAVIRVAPTTALLLTLWVPIAVMLARANGVIQGKELQILLHGSTALVNFAVLTVSCILAVGWAGVSQLLLGRLAVTIATVFILFRSLKVRLYGRNGLVSPDLLFSTLIVSSMWFAANLDVLLGRALLDGESVGQIAVAAMLVNSVLLMPGLVAAVVYPRAVTHAEDRRVLNRMLMASVCIAAVLQLIFALVLLFTSSFLIDWLAGEGHEVAKDVVFPLALAYIPLGMSIVMTQFLLAIGRFTDSIVFVILVGMTAALMTLGTGGASEFVAVLNLSAWLLAGGLLIQIVFRLRGVDG